MTYATDGRCHNAELGTFNHECGKPARWLGTTRRGFQSGYCDHCKMFGIEGMACVSWEQLAPLPKDWTWDRVELLRAKWDISANMVPIATTMGVVAWGTINTARAGF